MLTTMTTNKIYSSYSDFEEMHQTWKAAGYKIVFTNGCFDLLHLGHIDLLSRARATGDRLIIGLNTDASVHRLKGNHRPLNNQETRAGILEAMLMVDAVILFDEDTPLNLISDISPDVLVKGGDYARSTIVGADFVENNGGRVIIVPLLEGYSTTAIIHKIQSTHEN